MYSDRGGSSTDHLARLNNLQRSASIHGSMMSSILARCLYVLAGATRVVAIIQPTPTRTLSSAPSIAILASRSMITQSGWKDWLRSPASESSGHALNTCGVSGTHHWYCFDESATCTNTIFTDGNVYEYCSTPGQASQTFDTAVYDYYSGWSYSSYPQMGQYWYALVLAPSFLR